MRSSSTSSTVAISPEKIQEKNMETTEKTVSSSSSSSTSPSSGGSGCTEPYQSSYLCISNNMCIDQDQDFKLACVQTYLDDFVRGCSVGVGGQKDFVGDCEGVGGRQSECPGGANGRLGGLGEELKRQIGGKGWRIEEVDRCWIGADPSEEWTGSEGCRNTGGIEKMEDCRMFCPEDCRHGGNVDFEEFGVGGSVDSIVDESCRHNDISHMDILQRNIPDRRHVLHSSSFADRCSDFHVGEMLHIMVRMRQASMTKS